MNNIRLVNACLPKKGTKAVDDGKEPIPWSDNTMCYVVDKYQVEGSNQMENKKYCRMIKQI
jgi:hypothetical protein